MPTNEFLAYATGGGANVVDQATYAAAGYVTAGRGSGILPSNVYNKIARQGNFVASSVAQFIADQTGQDVLDDGDQTAFVAQLVAALTSLSAGNFTTGDGKLTIKTTADTGWVLMNDGTIGDASSGGTTRANADCSALFQLLWNNVSNTYAPVSGGRGGSAVADFAAHKTIALTKQLGRAIIIAGSGSGLTTRSLGQILGEENHALTSDENGPHNHTLTDPGHNHTFSSPVGLSASATNGNTMPVLGSNTFLINTNTTGITIASSGLGTAHNNMQPSAAWNIEIKL